MRLTLASDRRPPPTPPGILDKARIPEATTSTSNATPLRENRRREDEDIEEEGWLADLLARAAPGD